MNTHMHNVVGVVTSIVVAAAGSRASAAPVTINGIQGNLSASAKFESSGSNLVVTLTNDSLSDVMVPSNVLTGVFFDIAGSPITLTPMSAMLNAGSSVVFGTTNPGNIVGGEFAYVGGLIGAPNGASYGISSSGLGLFGPSNRFPGTNLQGPDSPDGLQYGITSAGDNTSTGNQAVTGSNALIKNAVVFTLSGLPQIFDPSTMIGRVSFQYGTALSEPNVPGVLIPTPGVGALALAACMVSMKRKRRDAAV